MRGTLASGYLGAGLASLLSALGCEVTGLDIVPPNEKTAALLADILVVVGSASSPEAILNTTTPPGSPHAIVFHAAALHAPHAAHHTEAEFIEANVAAALIMLVPMTIGIELGHTVGGLVHLAGAVSAFVLSDQTRDALLSFVVQLVLIYSIHFLPARVQRLNRVGVYTCLHAEDNTEASRDSYLGMPETLEIAPETGVRRTLLVHVVVWLYVQ